MLLVPTDPLMVLADFPDGRGGDLRAARRTKAFTAERVGKLRVPRAGTPPLMEACPHRVVPRDLMLAPDRRDDDTLRALATPPDNLHVNAIGGRPCDPDLCDQAPQQGLALCMTQGRALPQVGQALAQGEELVSLLQGHSRLARFVGQTLGRFLGLA